MKKLLFGMNGGRVVARRGLLDRGETGFVKQARRHISGIAVVLFITIWVAANLAWLLENRAGQPHNIDEDGYFAMALNNYFGGVRSGPSGWFDTVLAPGVQAPLTSALSSILFLAFGPTFASAMAVVVLLAALSLGLTAVIAKQFGSKPLIWISLILLATSPGFIQMTRLYYFAIPATAATVATAYALMRTKQMTSWRWAIVLGICIGLMPLSRTMALAFIPGIAVVVLAQVVFARDGRGRRLINTGIAITASLLVAGMWLLPSGTLVFEYLTSYGYGAHSEEYARSTTTMLSSTILSLTSMLYLPHFLIILLGWACALGVCLKFARRGRRLEAVRIAVASPVFACALMVVVGCFAIATSENGGVGFCLPLIPLAIVVASWGFVSVLVRDRQRGLQAVVIATLLVLPLVISTQSFFVNSPLARERTIDIPGVSGLMVTQDLAVNPAYLDTTAGVISDRDSAPGWRVANEFVADRITRVPTTASVAFGFRHHFFNVNSVQVPVLYRLEYGIGVAQVDPTTIPDSLLGYKEWLESGPASTTCWLLTSPSGINEFEPRIDTSSLVRAAVSVGFDIDAEFDLPDGRSVTMWKSPSPLCAVD
ncbi:hypothetical protein E3T46_00095 [Cryobacterium sp. Hh11]|uniref:ArnT family glycosyltransferase n=1 Tax=Cryobacterium sp. Hh11 TaxID=2555868 RepID=UPI00106ABE59|nr:glycosyltransferase family 39 protein [Cryobacterium sp. Hh11]TFD54766.1 hypothetical protein E3T46_00095 [Cryobacterium sp. Hh11]